jgi:hypothetical protein
MATYKNAFRARGIFRLLTAQKVLFRNEVSNEDFASNPVP